MGIKRVQILLPISVVSFSPSCYFFNIVSYRRNPYLRPQSGHCWILCYWRTYGREAHILDVVQILNESTVRSSAINPLSWYALGRMAVICSCVPIFKLRIIHGLCWKKLSIPICQHLIYRSWSPLLWRRAQGLGGQKCKGKHTDVQKHRQEQRRKDNIENGGKEQNRTNRSLLKAMAE